MRKCCAGDSLNKYYIRIFVKECTSVNFNSKRKCCGVLDQMFLKDLNLHANSFSEYSVQIGKDSSGIDSGKCVFGEPQTEGHMFISEIELT